MNAEEITDERLTMILEQQGNWTYQNECQALARAELDRRQADKHGEKVVEERVKYRYFKYCGNLMKIEASRLSDITSDAKVFWFNIGNAKFFRWEEITAAEYESAKPKAEKVEPVVRYRKANIGDPIPCFDCGNVHEGNCVNTNEVKDKPETRSCEKQCGNCIQFGKHKGSEDYFCWFGLAVRDIDPPCKRWASRDGIIPEPKMVGEVPAKESDLSTVFHLHCMLNNRVNKLEEQMKKLLEKDAANKLREGK